MLGFPKGIRQNPASRPSDNSRRRLILFRLHRSQQQALADERLRIAVRTISGTTVTHITLSKTAGSSPSLEFYSDNRGEARRVTIERFPFCIGRSESADLRIESAEVSREHAEITERNGMWLVRDLASTNGTQVNGKLVKETLLSDGDILTVATTELTFVASPTLQFQRMVTQAIQPKQKPSETRLIPPEVAATRMATEAVLWQAIAPQLLAAKSLRHRANDAFFAAPADAIQPSSWDGPTAARDRLRELQRMQVAELALERGDAGRLFLAVRPVEVESPHRLLASLHQLDDGLPSGWELGVTISLPTDVDILRISETYHEARKQGLLVAYDKFQGNGSQVMHLESLLPDYLVLAPGMTRDITSARQPLRRLESLLAACEELVIKPVLPGGESAHTRKVCQEIGFDLVLDAITQAPVPPQAELVASA